MSDSVKYLKATWLCKCLGLKSLIDTKPFEIDWIKHKDCSPETDSSISFAVESKEEKGTGPCADKRRKVTHEEYVCHSEPSPSGSECSLQRKKIIEELEKLSKAYAIRKDTWRSYAYRKAIGAISCYNKDILTFQEARRIPGVGDKMASKIMEIIECGKSEKAEEIVDEKIKTLEVFCKIWGVGVATAEGWYAQGFRTLDDLKEKAKLNKQQQIGLRLYDDLLERIPRSEVVAIADVVEKEIKKTDNSLDVELVGSYRRGKISCGDVDLMIVNKGPTSAGEVLIRVTDGLREQGFLTDDLVALADSREENHHKKYFGICKLAGDNQVHRRIDLFVVPQSEYATALFHYTGSALFNRSIKILAAKRRMTLTAHGLYADSLRKGSKVTSLGQLIPTPTEADIFKQLDLPYKLPHERDY